MSTTTSTASAIGALRLAVKPLKACTMLDCGLTRLYELLNSGELESYKDGYARKITVASIEAYVARRLAASRAAAAGQRPEATAA